MVAFLLQHLASREYIVFLKGVAQPDHGQNLRIIFEGFGLFALERVDVTFGENACEHYIL